MNISKTAAYVRVSSTVDNLKQASKARINQFSESAPGKKVLSLLNYVKKVANAPIELVKKHPKTTIAAGMITTVVGSITANVPAIGIGMTLIAAGALAQASNRHTEKQTNSPQAPVSTEMAS
ncbi:hypothetical protein [Kluyvera intermedia]|uniref:hypothetical protein n=1 Tax=Kluyvera intermedia TaxID=61648 RepID=UPI00372D5092